uniref:Uncharacterized protein n=1 Tax=Arundo donax TaxID=35708 RepID=A0A0A8Y1Q0_ARUDO
MQNSARLQQHGIPILVGMFANKIVVSPDKNKRKRSNGEDFESEYNPDQDNTYEGDLCATNKDKEALKESMKTSKETSNKRSADMAPGGIKPRHPKRVVADQLTTRAMRSKKSLAPSDIPMPTPSVPLASQAKENVGNFDDHTHPFIEDDGIDQPDISTPITNGSDGIATQQGNDTVQPDGHNKVDSEGDGTAQLDGHNQVASEGDGIAQPDDQNQIHSDSEEEEPCNRGGNMGKALQRLSRARHGKLSVVITKGRIRPVVPLVATKFATECNIGVRNHVPVLKNWKIYKNQPGLLRLFMGKLALKWLVPR